MARPNLTNAGPRCRRPPFAAKQTGAIEFDEDEGQASREVALAGGDRHKADQLLRHAKQQGAAVLNDLTRQAVERLVDTSWTGAPRLFNDEERARLADALSATTATAHLLGRVRIRKRLEAVEQSAKYSAGDSFAAFDDNPLRPFAPLKALAYFRRLVPKLNVKPKRFGAEMKRRGFTLAVATEKTLLRKVKEILQKTLETGQAANGPQRIQQVLDQVGVAPKNPQYAEMVFRTNMMDAYNVGADQERMAPDVIEAFPAWRYAGVRDGRQRSAHEVHFGKYFPADVAFATVRDSVKGEFDGYQCRCVCIPVTRREWARLQDKGAAFASFAETPAVPDYRQDNGFHCGPAALQWVLHALLVEEASEADLAKQMGSSPQYGTPPDAMELAAADHGLQTAEQHLGGINLLDKHTERGGLVLCPIQMHEVNDDERRRRMSGHWVVVYGIYGDQVKYHDPARGPDGGDQEMSRDEWIRRWLDCSYQPGGGTRWFVRYGIYLSRE
jgi:predicted double-glycine peptidase